MAVGLRCVLLFVRVYIRSYTCPAKVSIVDGFYTQRIVAR